jgi:hypothetical protein
VSETNDRIVQSFRLSGKFDADVRAAMSRALGTEEKKDDPKEAGYMAAATLAIELATSLANIIVAVRRPEAGRTFRMAYDLVIGMNSNLFWSQHAPALLPLLHTALMDHLDSVALQDERGEVKVSPYDKLIMGAEAAPMAMFSMLLFLVGGPLVQMHGSVLLKKDLMPLLMH